MKFQFFLIVAFASLAAGSCKKSETSFRSSGTLGGFDLRACASCGGRFVTIDFDSGSYRTYGLPAGSEIDFNDDHSQIPILFNWHLGSVLGSEKIIVIDDVARRK